MESRMKQELLYALRILRAKVAAGNAPPTGIRAYIVNHPLVSFYFGDLQAMWVGWPRYSGDPCYPVPAFNEEGKQLAYMHAYPAFSYAYLTGTLWDTTDHYGAARVALLEWLIAELERETQP